MRIHLPRLASNTRLRLTLAAASVLTLYAVASRTADLPSRSQTLRLSAKLGKEIVDAGGPVIVEVEIKNVSPRTAFYIDTDQDSNFALVVKDSHGEVVPLTQYGSSLVSHSWHHSNRVITMRLAPNQTAAYRLVVNSRYDMTLLGFYTVTVKRAFGSPTSAADNEAVSNTVSVMNGGSIPSISQDLH